MVNTAIREKLEQKKTRLTNYLAREAYMLSPDAIQSYGLSSGGGGMRNVQRYNTDLAEIRRAIKELEVEVAELEGQLTGAKPRKAVAIVPRDI